MRPISMANNGSGGDGSRDESSEYYDHDDDRNDAEMMNYYSSSASSSPPLELFDDHNIMMNDDDHQHNDNNNDDDGSDHAYNDHPPTFGESIHRHPQHYQHQHQSDDYIMNHQNSNNQHNDHHHPHQHHATPHGNMTSILSAAGSYSPQKKKSHTQQHNSQQYHHNSQQHYSRKKTISSTATAATTRTTTIALKEDWQQNTLTSSSEDNAAKRALRKRASKYFHRGGGGGGVTKPTTATAVGNGVGVDSPSTINYGKCIDSSNSNGNIDRYHGNGRKNYDDDGEDNDDGEVEQQDVEFVDEKEVIRMMNHHHPPTSNSLSSSSNATTALLSASTSSPILSGAGATPDSATTESTTSVLATTTTMGAAAAAAGRQTAIQGNSSSTSPLSFFPRATSASSSTLTRNLNHHRHRHHFTHHQEQIPHSLSSSEEYTSADPSLQTYLSPSSSYDNLLEVQSNATSGYTSGGGGSDLEVAARRILRGKKGGGRKNGGVGRHPPSRSGGIMSESEDDDGDDTDDDDNNGIVNLGHGYHINRKNNQNTTNNSGTGSLPLGWRERIQRKTGIQLLKLPLSQPPPPSQLPSSSFPTPSTTDCVTAAPIETTNPVDYSYCYDDNGDSCNQLGVYRGDGELAMTKRVNNVDNADVSAASTDYDKDEMDDVIVNEEWQHPRQQHQFQQQQQYEESYPPRHPPTPSPTESIETTYHLEDLENNGAFPSRSPNRNHYHGQNGGYDRGYTAQPNPSDHSQFEQHQQQEHRRLPILHEYPDPHSTQYHTTEGGYDDASYSYDAEVDEDKEDENDFDRNYYSNDNEEYNTDILIETTTNRDRDPFQTFGPILKNDNMNDNGDIFDNKICNINKNNPLVPIIINEYGFPPIPIKPDVAQFGDNYYVKKEGVRMSNNSTFISQQSRNITSPSSQKTGKRRVHFASSVVVGEVSGGTVKGQIQGGGGDRNGAGVDGVGRGSVNNDNFDSDGFDDDEYFHRFYYNSTLTEERLQEKHNCQQRRRCRDESTRGGVPTSGDWEEILATPKVEWVSTSPSRRDLRTSSINELNTGVSSSAWSVPESVSLKNAAGSAPAANVFASWNGNDRSHPTDNGGDGQGESSISHSKLQKETSNEKFIVEMNSVMHGITQSSSRPPRGKSSMKSRSHQQRVYAFYDQWVQASKDAQLSTRKTAEYSLSDGDLSEKGNATGQSTGGEGGIGTNRQKKRGLKFFRRRNRAYNSEGDRSDTSVEGGEIEGNLSFDLSPLSSGRKENTMEKKKGGLGAKIKSPRRMRLFGHTNHHSLGNIDIENEKFPVKKESEVEGEVARSLFIGDVSIETRICQSSVASASSAATEHCVKDSITESEVDATPETDTSQRCSKEPESTTIISDSIEQEDEQPAMALNLNDSRETYSTLIASNAKAQTRFRHPKALSIVPRAVTPANKYKPSGMPSSRSNILPKSGPNGNKTVVNDRIASQRKPGWAQVAAECDDVETVSTLGSLVTQDSKTFPVPIHNAPFSSDASTVTELSEIEKLRRENYLLREKLENASQLSSKVSSNAESLKLEYNRLREEFESVSQLPTIAENQIHRHNKHGKSFGSIHQTTLETLLEKGNNKKIKKSRRRARRDSPVADFNHLPPVAHLINGVDFDDDSITSSFTFKGFHSQIKYPSRGDGCETQEDLLKKTCSRIATTTRSVASQMKSAIAQDPNNEVGAAPSSRTLNCFTTCRRDTTNDGTTIYVTEQQFNSARGNNRRHNHSAVPSHRSQAASDKGNRVVK